MTTTFTPWDSALSAQTSNQFFTLTSDRAASPARQYGPSTPAFHAAAKGNTAAAHSPFTLATDREDGDQNLTGLNVTAPPGFSGDDGRDPLLPNPRSGGRDPRLSGHRRASQPELPGSYLVGTAMTGAGAGYHPVFAQRQGLSGGPQRRRAA